MTAVHDHKPLSRIDLMVLARLTSKTAPTRADLIRSLVWAGVPFMGPQLAEVVDAAIVTLSARGFVEGPPRPRSSRSKRPPPAPRFRLSPAGRDALCDAFDLEAAPTWPETLGYIVPALALHLRPDSDKAENALRDVESIVIALLQRDPTLGATDTIELCDRLIARRLGLSMDRATMTGIRACALAMHCGVEDRAELIRMASSVTTKTTAKRAPELVELATSFARKHLRADFGSKAELLAALRRYWLANEDEADEATDAASWSATVPAYLDLARASSSDAALLSAVRSALPRIDARGRYGRSNVFIVSLWKQLARAGLQTLSLEQFKDWLVRANRDSLLNLARADLIDDMDPRLVAASQIENLGATFHFVVDPQQPASARTASHAR
jgi:hypothetical protein